jgi:putative spermidine/putrescine transport system substrate-binding protein
VQAYDGPIYVADAALYLKSAQPDLGIEDPYQLNDEQYAAALDLLRQQRALVGRYWHDAFVQIDDFTNEGVAASSSWPFQVNILQASEAPIASVIPAEGATGWADTTMMHANAPHPNCAYMWLEWSISPAVQGDLAAWFGSVPAVPSACEGNDLLGPDGCVTNGIDNFDQISFWKTPTEDCNGTAEAGSCVPYYRWVTDYLAVIGGR